MSKKLNLNQSEKRIEIEWDEIKETIKDSVFDIADFNIGKASKRILNTVKFVDTHESIAFELIYNSLDLLFINILKSNFNNEIQNDELLVSKTNMFKLSINDDLCSKEVIIQYSDLQHPEKWNYIDTFKEKLEKWLIEHLRVKRTLAKESLTEINYLFSVAMRDTYMNNETKFGKLLSFFNENNIFTKKVVALNERKEHISNLSNKFHSTLQLNSLVKLSDIYIDAQLKANRDSFDPVYSDPFSIQQRKFKSNNASELIIEWTDYVFNRTVDIPNTLTILGHPGQGKTSLAYKLIFDFVSKYGWSSCTISHTELGKSNTAYDYFKNPDTLLDSLPTSNSEKILIILDGLDEAFNSLDISEDFVLSGISKMNNWRYDDSKPMVSIVILSRHNYLKTKSLGRTSLIFDIMDLSDYKQFGLINKMIRAGIAKSEFRDDVETYKFMKDGFQNSLDLLKMPITLFILAKYNLRLSNVKNRGDIYKKVYENLITDNWKKLSKKRVLDVEVFTMALRQIAHAVNFSAYNSISYDEVESKIPNIKSILDTATGTISKEVNISLRNFLILFHFTESSRININKFSSRSFEFYHKTFQEYLSMEWIWYSLLNRYNLKVHVGSTSDLNTSVSRFIFNLIPPQGLSSSSYSFLSDIIQNHIRNFPSDQKVYHLSKTLIKSTTIFNKNSFLDFESNMDTSNNFIYKLNNFCFLVIFLIKRIHFDKRVLSFRYLQDAMPFLSNFLREKKETISLSHEILESINISGIRLADADLSYTDISDVNLSGSDLSGTNFQGANITRTSFQGAILSGANLKGVNLYSVNLHGADLNSCIVDRLDWLECLKEMDIIGYNTIRSLYVCKEMDKNSDYLLVLSAVR